MHTMTNHFTFSLFLLLDALADALPAPDTSVPAPEVSSNEPIVLTYPWPARLGFPPYFGRQTL